MIPISLSSISVPNNRYQRLIDWNVKLLAGLLKQIAARRIDLKQNTNMNTVAPAMQLQGGSTALDEVTEIIKLPQFDDKAHRNKTRPDDIVLNDVVMRNSVIMSRRLPPCTVTTPSTQL
jgi:hypothetical protein